MRTATHKRVSNLILIIIEYSYNSCYDKGKEPCRIFKQNYIVSEMSANIKTEHKELFSKRKKFERGNPNVYSLPLPWRPGWVNLLSGRAMGGNRFQGESNREIFRRIVQQLPYYVPPVVIANLINLVFFIFLLQNPNILTALRPRHGENIAEKSITVCSGLDMVNINLTHFVFANKEDADVSIFK